MPKMRVKAKHGRAGWWSRGLLVGADRFSVGEASGPKARGDQLCPWANKKTGPRRSRPFKRQGVMPSVITGLAGSIHYLQGRAASEFLFHVGNDTHTHILVHAKVDRHKGPFSLAHSVTLGGDEVADVVDRLEGIVQLDTGVGTELALEMTDRGADIDIGGQVLSLEFGGLRCLGQLDDDFVLGLTQLGSHHKEEQEHKHDIGKRTRGNAGNVLLTV